MTHDERPTTMPTLSPEAGHNLEYVAVETLHFAVTLTPEGHTQYADPDDTGTCVDVNDSWLECDICGILNEDALATHGIDPDWQAP